MKKVLAIILALTLVLALCACGKTADTGTAGGQTAGVSRVIYTLVGAAGLWSISLLFRDRDPVKE